MWSTAGCAARHGRGRWATRWLLPRTTAISPTVCWCCTRRRRTGVGSPRPANCWTSPSRTSPTAAAASTTPATTPRHWSAGRAIPPTVRPRPGQSALAGALLTYAALTGSAEHRAAAEAAVRAVGSLSVSQPRFFGWTLAVAEGLAAGPVQVGVVGEDGAGPLTTLAWRQRPPGAVVVSGDARRRPAFRCWPTARSSRASRLPTSAGAFVCDLPVSTEEELARALRTG